MQNWKMDIGKKVNCEHWTLGKMKTWKNSNLEK